MAPLLYLTYLTAPMKLGASSLIRAKTALNDPRSLSLSKGNFRRFYCSCANYVCIVLFYFFIFKLTKQFYRGHIVCKSQRVRVLTLEGYKTRPLLCHPPRSFSICLTPLKQIKNFVSEKRFVFVTSVEETSLFRGNGQFFRTRNPDLTSIQETL